VLLHQLHRVSQALAGQVWDDADLTADLAPLAPVAPVSDDTHALDLLPMEPAEYVEPVEQALPPDDPGIPGLPQVIRPGGPPRRSRRGPVLLVVALVLALAAGLGAYWFGWARYTATPGVIGMSQQAATAKLVHAGFDVTIGDPAFSETVPKGDVVSSDPQPGSRVLDHGTVTLTVSQGKERYAVPKLRGLTVDQAQDALLGRHLTYGRSVGRWSENIPKGQVMGSNPAAGHRERRSTPVDLQVSKGPAPIRVRDWTGKPATRAEEAMQAQGLQVDASDQEYSDTVPEGSVISQDPAHGVLHRGDTVSLTVSRGPELVEIPGNLRTMGVEAATTLLEDAGFKVEVEKADFYLGLNLVADSDPNPGSMVAKGSTVVLQIV